MLRVGDALTEEDGSVGLEETVEVGVSAADALKVIS